MIEKYTDPKYIQGFPNVGYDFSDDYKQGYSDGGIKELEKVKEKIFNKQDEFIHSNLLSECNVRYGLEIAEMIIDKEIEELKGEGNENF